MIRQLTTIFKAAKVALFLAAITAVMLLSMKSFISWRISSPDNKSAGRSDDVGLNELLLDPSTYGFQDGFIELYNRGDKPVDIDGWRIYTSGGSQGLSGTVGVKGFLVFYSGIADHPSREVQLKNRKGLLVDTYSLDIRPRGVSVGRSPDGSESWIGFEYPTPGAPNTVSYQTSTTGTLPECFVNEFYSVQENMVDQGFTGDSYKFCNSYSEQVAKLDPVIKKKVAETKDKELRSNIVREVAQRDVAAKREKRVLTLTISDSQLLNTFTGFLSPEFIKLGLDGEIKAMNKKFKAMIYDIMNNGASGEKHELKLQLEYYLKDKDDGGIRILKLDPDDVRMLLVDGKSNEEIVFELSK